MTIDEIRRRIDEILGDEPSSPVIRYTRRRDRVLAALWPPKRRQLRRMQRMTDFNARQINALYAETMTNLMLYGTGVAHVVRREDPPPGA